MIRASVSASTEEVGSSRMSMGALRRIARAEFARDNHALVRDKRLARDTGLRVVPQEGVENRIGDAVADLVGMASGNRLGGERTTECGHSNVSSLAAFGKAPGAASWNQIPPTREVGQPCFFDAKALRNGPTKKPARLSQSGLLFPL